ncbi:MAG: Maf-like protein [Prevotellaceae bacterium]|jgi:septum formation protein|nr:Maf-like protein [Prevotellaceae bacterium]
MLQDLGRYNIILASNSPRRHELLRGLDIRFEVRTTGGIDESYPADLQGEQIPLHIAEKKADFFQPSLNRNDILITADTVVLIDGAVFGKPQDKADARRMLTQLSGRTHRVITGVCLSRQYSRKAFAATTDVTFAELSDEEIDYYLDLYRPYDKAGAYGVQEWIGYVAVESINGSFYNVMGLPVHKLYKELKLLIE